MGKNYILKEGLQVMRDKFKFEEIEIEVLKVSNISIFVIRFDRVCMGVLV